MHFNNVPVVSGLFTAIKWMDRYPEHEEHYIMLCILESGSSELNTEEFDPNNSWFDMFIDCDCFTRLPSFLDANSNNAHWKSPDLGQCKVVVNRVSDLQDITVTNGKPLLEFILDTQASC